MLGADRRPAGPHTGCDWCAAVEELRSCDSGAARDRIEEVVVARLKQGGYAVGFDHGWRRRGKRSDGAVAIEVLVEDGLEVLQRRTGARDVAGEVGDVVAVAIGAPDIKETGGGIVEGDVVTA